MGTPKRRVLAQLQRTRSRPLPRDADLRCVHGRLAQDGEPHTQRQLLLQARQQELLQGQRRQAVRQSDAVRYTTEEKAEEKAERGVGVFVGDAPSHLETRPARIAEPRLRILPILLFSPPPCQWPPTRRDAPPPLKKNLCSRVCSVVSLARGI